VAPHDNAFAAADKDRDDTVQRRDEARPPEICDGEWASSELHNLISVSNKPFEDDTAVER
jgi:hypothetical protein